MMIQALTYSSSPQHYCLETVNETNVTCSGGTVTNPVEDNTDIIISGGYSTSSVLHYLTVIHVPGVPDPVSGLVYDDTVVIDIGGGNGGARGAIAPHFSSRRSATTIPMCMRTSIPSSCTVVYRKHNSRDKILSQICGFYSTASFFPNYATRIRQATPYFARRPLSRNAAEGRFGKVLNFFRYTVVVIDMSQRFLDILSQKP